jgi:hypothetical protein
MKLRDVIYGPEDIAECIMAFLEKRPLFFHNYTREEQKEFIKKWSEEEWEPYKFKNEDDIR